MTDEELDIGTEPTVTEWKAQRVGGGGSKADTDPMWVRQDEFVHSDYKAVEHWVFHQQIRDPGVIYEIYEVQTTLREVL